MKHFTVLLVMLIAHTARAETLTFDQALDQIVARNTSVATETANLAAAHARALPARLVFAPGLAVLAKAGHENYSGYASNGQDLELDADLNLFRFGADVAGWRAASRDIETEEELVAATRLSAEDGGVQALVARIQRELEVGVDSRLADVQEELRVIARERYERGLLPLQEADKVAVDLDNARARLADAQVLAIAARSALATALGRLGQTAGASPGANDLATIDWPWRAILSDESRVTALIATRFEPALRPDWRADQRRLEAEDARLTRADAEIWPSLDASFSYGTETGFLSPTGATFGPGYSGLLTLTVPLFDHLTNYSHAQVQSATRDVAEQALEQSRRDTLGEWETANRSFRVAVDSAQARERTLGVARKLYQDNLARFRAGKASANDLSVDQTRLSDSELFAVEGWAAAHLAYARLCHALGRPVGECAQNLPAQSPH